MRDGRSNRRAISDSTARAARSWASPTRPARARASALPYCPQASDIQIAAQRADRDLGLRLGEFPGDVAADRVDVPQDVVGEHPEPVADLVECPDGLAQYGLGLVEPAAK